MSQLFLTYEQSQRLTEKYKSWCRAKKVSPNESSSSKAFAEELVNIIMSK